ncbi:hypothetical protein B0H19DRAFT_1265291 [Mycena capillaripes]|nr:hypothetical protein B0H19DRAFT_1265291 [Mycena capillaripes]
MTIISDWRTFALPLAPAKCLAAHSNIRSTSANASRSTNMDTHMLLSAGFFANIYPARFSALTSRCYLAYQRAPTLSSSNESIRVLIQRPPLSSCATLRGRIFLR